MDREQNREAQRSVPRTPMKRIVGPPRVWARGGVALPKAVPSFSPFRPRIERLDAQIHSLLAYLHEES